MIEANANKFTFVWKKTAEKSLKKSLTHVQEVIRSIEKDTGLIFISRRRGILRRS